MRYLLFICLLVFSVSAFATHNRAGEITYKHISGLTYEFTLTTYVYTPSPADRPTLTLKWGDGTQSVVSRMSKINLPKDISKNTYIGQHTYTGNGIFTVSMEDPNRNGSVVNIPNSINVPFYVETQIVINPFFHTNSSPVLLNPPIDNGCVGFPFLHNPSAFDIDGDSLTYELVPCKEQNGLNINGYTYPQTSSIFSIDSQTGTLTWDSPVQIGEYNIAIKISEWRNGTLLGTVLRDMQVDINACNNNPPEITLINDTCVEVGQHLKFGVSAMDINNDVITLTSTGGPYILSNSHATFPSPVIGTAQVADTFRWTPICEHVRNQPYLVSFKAEDDGTPVNLVDIKTLWITVVAPAPKNLVALPKGTSIQLSWNKSYCTEADHYDIYRHNGYINYQANNCETGVPSWTGYVRVGSTNTINDTTFIDNNNGYGLIQGTDYCYMVVAVFDDKAESYPSLEACASLVKDVPVITHVTVDTTDIGVGEVTTIWAKPTVIDTSIAPGPYTYLIYHSNEQNGQNLALVDSLSSINDTVFVMKNLNTVDKEHWYKITLVNNTPGNRFIMGPSQIASSVYISTIGFDNIVELTWNETVPWLNDTFVVYRQNTSMGFDSIGITNTQTYVDSNLVNGRTFCYKVQSIGQYTATGFVKPIKNWSQVSCATPIDNEPPCTPDLVVYPDCENVENLILWNNPNLSCANDVTGYKLFYKDNLSGDFIEIFSTNDPTITQFTHTNLNTIAGCYSIVAIDSFQNVSIASVQYCVDIDSCERYRLPNVFTPNDDNFNDVFVPFPYDFVEKVNIHIYNRWGKLVFQTTDPDINWDGKDLNTQKTCSDGVYFYVCEVFELRLEGIVKREIHGSVTIIGQSPK